MDIIELFLNDLRFPHLIFLYNACKNGKDGMVLMLLNRFKFSVAERSLCFIGALDNDDVKKATYIAKFFTDNEQLYVDMTYQNNSALIMACEKNNVEMVKIILQDPNVNPIARYNTPLSVAITGKRWDIVKLLLSDKRTNPSIYGPQTILEHCILFGADL